RQHPKSSCAITLHHTIQTRRYLPLLSLCPPTTTDTYTLSLHDALPISKGPRRPLGGGARERIEPRQRELAGHAVLVIAGHEQLGALGHELDARGGIGSVADEVAQAEHAVDLPRAIGEHRAEGLEVAVDVGQNRVPHSGGGAELLADAVEDAVDEAARLLGTELLCDLERLVDRHLGRHVGRPQELVDALPENVAVHDRHAVEAPVLGEL